MIRALTLLAGLACADVQEKEAITATVTSLPADPAAGRKPTLLVEGKAALPDGARLDLRLYFGEGSVRELRHGATRCQGGQFTHSFQIFPERNLAGVYFLRIVLSPALQPPDVQKGLADRTRKLEAEVKFEVGDAREQERDRAAVLERFASQIREFQTMGDEVEARLKEGKLDAKGWGKAKGEWLGRALEVQKLAIATPEYRAFNYDEWVADGFEVLQNHLLKLINTSADASQHPNKPYAQAAVKVTRQGLDQTAAGFLKTVSYDPVKERKKLAALAEDARRVLRDALGSPSPDDARKKFYQAILLLAGATGADYDAVFKILNDSPPFFAALSAARPEEARKLHEELDRRLAEVRRSIEEAPPQK